MGLFKNKKEGKETSTTHELPELPELPKLPEFSDYKKGSLQIHQLPSFPNNSLGDKFSQDTIKEAISGKKEGDWEENANDFESFDEEEMMQQPFQKLPRIKNINEMSMNSKEEKMSSSQNQGPLFIRLDKFEEAQDSLDEIKKQIEEINKLLDKTKEIKQKEEEELKHWELELNNVKRKIESIDNNLFSKL